MQGYDFKMSRGEMLFWIILAFLIAGTITGMQCGCSAVGANHDTAIQDGGRQVINQGITYWDLYWSGLILVGLYVVYEVIKYKLLKPFGILFKGRK